MTGDTWSETTTDTLAEDGPAPTPTADGTAPGRFTVLPRVEDVHGVPQLVQDARKRFEVVEKLGQGGLGEVVGARDNDIGRHVAIKRIRPDRASRGAFLRFVQEVRTVGRLDHPGIVPIHDVGRDERGDYYFVMKLVRGETVDDLIARLRAGDRQAHAEWPFERRVALFTALLHAVAHAHERGVVHRDIKPENVMIGPHGQVQLLDWGVAKVLGAAEAPADQPHSDPSTSGSVTHTRAGSLIGTPRYMSPEQAAGEPVDVRADTWALSMLLYELLVLEHPLEGEHDVEALLQALRTRDVPHPRSARVFQPQGRVPADLGWFVHDGLRRDPAVRYQSVQQMIARLQRRADGDIPAHCPMTFQKRMLKKAERRLDRTPAVFTALALLLTLSSAGSIALSMALAAVVLLG